MCEVSALTYRYSCISYIKGTRTTLNVGFFMEGIIMAHTIDELREKQALPLSIKIALTRERIRAWVHEFGESGVYVSFSGGKDSTVLLDIVRNVCGYKDVPAVFVDTGLEYPEIREFVKTFDNVTILKPKMNFKQVIEKYGYPFFGKETAEAVSHAKKYLTRLRDSENALTDRQTDRQTDRLPYRQFYEKLTGTGRYKRKESIPSTDLIELAKSKDKWEMPYRVSIMLGTFETNWQKKKDGLLPKDGEPSRAKYSQEKYQFMLNAPFEISSTCCNVMKKNPIHKYAKETGRNPITAQMASESRLRTQKWLQHGCNAFDSKNPISNPMSFWTEQDVLLYIKQNKIPICSVYGEIIEDRSGTDEVENQTTISDWLGEEYKSFDASPLPLKTTGCNRTGCMFCGFGCHLEKEGEGRFEKMKQTHPKQYEWIMKPWDEGGLGYKEVIDWINEHGNLHIKY